MCYHPGMEPTGQVLNRRTGEWETRNVTKAPSPAATMPPPEDAIDEETGALLMRDPRTPKERDEQRATNAQGQALLDEGLREEAVTAGLIDRVTDAEIATAIANAKPKGRTRQQRRRYVLTQQALLLRAQGLNNDEIAQTLGIAVSTLTGWLTTHRRHMTAEVIDQQLDMVAVPLAVENLVHGLLAGDKDYTIETLKGRGKLKKTVDGSVLPPEGLPELRIRVEDGGNVNVQINGSPMAAGKIVGVAARPRALPAPADTSGTRIDEPVGVGLAADPVLVPKE